MLWYFQKVPNIDVTTLFVKFNERAASETIHQNPQPHSWTINNWQSSEGNRLLSVENSY